MGKKLECDLCGLKINPNDDLGDAIIQLPLEQRIAEVEWICSLCYGTLGAFKTRIGRFVETLRCEFIRKALQNLKNSFTPQE